MNYQKVDAALAGALSDRDDLPFVVSVCTTRPLTPTEQNELTALGGQGANSGLGIYSVHVDRAKLAELTEKPWVRLVSLAHRLRLS